MNQIVVLDLTAHWPDIKRFADSAMVGGKSTIYQDQDKRTERLWRDQLVGQSGEAALHLYHSGSIRGYLDSRSARGHRSRIGDNGTDMPGAKVDIKTSYLSPGKDPKTFALFVRDREFSEETIYYHATMTCVRDPFQIYVAIHGWIPGDEYISFTQPYEFNGEVVAGVSIHKLYRPVPLSWQGVTYMNGLPQTHFNKGEYYGRTA